MLAAKESVPPSPVAPTSAVSPASTDGPREKSAHPRVANSKGASAQRRCRRRSSELIGHVEAQDVVGDLVHLLKVDEVEDPEPEVPGTRNHAEVVSRPVGVG